MYTTNYYLILLVPLVCYLLPSYSSPTCVKMKYPKLNHIYIIIELYTINKKSDEKSLKDSDPEIFLPRVHTPLFHTKLLHRFINLIFTQLLALLILLNGISLHLGRVTQMPDVCPEWLKVD